MVNLEHNYLNNVSSIYLYKFKSMLSSLANDNDEDEQV
jgi:hypothetical protein